MAYDYGIWKRSSSVFVYIHVHVHVGTRCSIVRFSLYID